MCGTFSWFWICARRLYMHGGKRVMLTFPMSSALNVAFFASRMPRISRRSARKAETMSSFTGSGRRSSMCRWIAFRMTRSALARCKVTYPRSTRWLISFHGASRIVFVKRRKSVKWRRKPPSSRRRSIASCPAMWIAKSSDSDSRRPSAAIASRRANLLIRYVSSRADTRIRDTGYASSWASWSAGAIATRSDAPPRSSASRTRAFPRFRARAYAGSRRISSRLTFSARMNADASRRNGYFARVASSTSEGTPRSHKRPTRGPAKRELRIPMGPSLGLRCARRGRRDAQLHHQARDVPLPPVLDALAVLEPRDVDARDRHFLPGRRDAHELAAVGARHRPADDDLVAFRDDVINRRAAVGERGAQHEEPLLLAFAAGWHSRCGGVVDIVLGRHLVNHADVASVQNLVVKHSRSRFVLLFSHVVLLLETPIVRPKDRLLYNDARPPLAPLTRSVGSSASRMSHPKVFVEADNESPDGGTPRILRGSLPRSWPCDSRRGPRSRPPGTPAGFVSALPRRVAGVGSRRGERLRCAHDAARARLADDGWSPCAGVAVVPRLRSISADRATILGPGGRLGLLPLLAFRQRVGLRARGDPSSDSDGLNPRCLPPRLCPGSVVPFGRRPGELLGLSHCAKGRARPRRRVRARLAERPSHRAHRPRVQCVARETPRGFCVPEEDDPRHRLRHRGR